MKAIKFNSYIGEDIGIQVTAWFDGDDPEIQVLLGEPGENPKLDDLWYSLSEDVQVRLQVQACEERAAHLADEADEMAAREEDYWAQQAEDRRYHSEEDYK